MRGDAPGLIAIARRADGPVPVRVERTAEPDWTGDPMGAAALVAERVPLRTVDRDDAVAGRDPTVIEARRAWASLESARITPDSAAALLLVLVRTTLDEPVPCGIARFDGAEPPAPFRPTAAHPRAYQGTAAKPPKRPAPRRFDLQAVALDPRASRALVEQFPREVAAARGLLAEPDRVRVARALEDEPAGVAAWDGTALPGWFRCRVWPQLRWLPGDATARILDELRHRAPAAAPSLLAAIGWWLTQDTRDAALPWLHAALALPDELAEVALFVGAEAGARSAPVRDVPLSELAAATGRDIAGFAYELWTLLDGQRRGVAPRLMLPGLELSRESGPRHSMTTAEPAEVVPAEAIRQLGAHTGQGWRTLGLDLWRALSRCPGLADVVLKQPWDALGKAAAEELLGAMAWAWPEADTASRDMGDWWIEFLPGMVDLARGRSPAYAAKVADTLAEAVSVFASPRRLRELWPWLLPTAGRLAAPPFRADVRSFLVWNNLVEHPPAELKQAVVDGPDRAWTELERRSRVPAQAEQLSCGFDALGRAHGARLAEAFLARTPLLYEVASLVGAMSDSSAARVCRAADGATDPVVWLERVRDRALTDLSRGLDADVSQPGVRHALLLQRSLADNRRALRKFLRAHMDGDAAYVARHPLTRRWLAAHPMVDPRRWTTGITLEADVPAIGPLTLRVETDPLEALRLGTYVGSCLSVRGLCDYSAVAVALDVNKQVVYARNHRGSVIARQLLAVSEGAELVAFAVYPLSAPEAVRRLFARYDREFAAELGLALWSGQDEDYRIAEVISSRWWDDGAWQSGFVPSSSS